MAEDAQMKEVLDEVSASVEKKFGKRPYVVIVAKANLYFANEEDKKGGKVSGTADYAYLAKPQLGKNGISKILVNTARLAVNTMEKAATEEER